MSEIAFRLNYDTDFGKHYQVAKDQRISFRNLARYFANKHFNAEKMSYFQSRTLYSNIKEPGQVCKNKVQGLWKYRKDSALQKAWEEDVASKIDFNALDWLLIWHWDYIDRGSYALWDYDGMIYGFLSDTEKTPGIPEEAEAIKLSEYYRVLEKAEGNADG